MLLREAWIGVWTLLAIAMLSRGDRRGNFAGLLASPAWLWATVSAGEWGQVAVSAACMAIYLAGAIALVTEWIAERRRD